MKGIFKHENVYVLVNKDIRDDINTEDINALVFSSNSEYEKNDVYLYGGRVHLKKTDSKNINLQIDGNIIKKIVLDHGDYSSSDEWNLETMVAFLNQMENLGIDTFIDNYREQLKNIKKDIESIAEKLEQELSIKYDQYKDNNLFSYRRFIKELSCIIFLFFINMNAGLENHFYTDAYDTIVNMYF